MPVLSNASLSQQIFPILLDDYALIGIGVNELPENVVAALLRNRLYLVYTRWSGGSGDRKGDSAIGFLSDVLEDDLGGQGEGGNLLTSGERHILSFLAFRTISQRCFAACRNQGIAHSICIWQPLKPFLLVIYHLPYQQPMPGQIGIPTCVLAIL